MLKNANSYSLLNRKQTKQFKSALKAKRLKISKGIIKKRKRHVIAKTALVLAVCAGVYIFYNIISATINNANTGTENNFDNEQIIEDNNDNDIIWDDDGNIVVDPIEDSEKQLLLDNLNDKLLADLQNRAPQQIDQIDEIISISQIPYNMCEDDNEYDQYILSILFKANDTIYSLNYLTGETFQTTQENAQNYFGDFIVFLNNCSLDLCQNMGEAENEFISSLGNNQIFYVMPYYYGYDQASNLTYFIPVFFNDNGNIYEQVYYALADDIDAYGHDPLQTLANQLNGGDVIFEMTSNINEDLNKIVETYQQFKDDLQEDNENEIE